MRRAALLLGDRPEAWLYGAAAACWAALVLAPPPSAATSFCLGGLSLAGLSFAAGPALAGFGWTAGLAHWLLMVGAMMLPMAAMAVRHVAVRSFRERQARAVAAFLLGYMAIWLAAGPFYLAAGLLVPLAAGGSTLVPLGAALAIAAVWQSTGAKRRALRHCHRTVPLAPSGWRADRACLAFGLAHGRSCLASCWALMLIPVAAGHHPLPMLLVALFALGERRSPAAEPLRGPVGAWKGLAGLLRSLDPSSAR